MKIIIELDNDMLEEIKENDFDFARNAVRNFQATIAEAIRNGKSIPDNATNGEIMMVAFPNQTVSCAIPITDRNGAKFYRTTINGVTDFAADVWNAPYKTKGKKSKVRKNKCAM